MATVPSEGPLGPLNGWVPDSTAFAYGLPGTLEPVPFFDPAGLCDGKSLDEVKMLREAEVTHGRVAMLATVGFIAQERGHFFFVEPEKDIGPAIRHLDEVRAVNPAFFELLTFAIGCAELQHGRLAMIAVAGFFAQELVDNKLILADIYKI